jgi:hypothetical protein
MNTNITPGKWEVKEVGTSIEIADENGKHICRLFASNTKEQNANAKAIASLPDIMRENEELKKLAASFYMDICRAYNAGKENAFAMVAEMRKMGEASGEFKSSHDYFVSEFPTFKTNVP